MFSPQMAMDSIPVRLSRRAAEIRALAHSERDEASRRQFLQLAADIDMLARRAATVEYPPEDDEAK
jgi:hypothetical protein